MYVMREVEVTLKVVADSGWGEMAKQRGLNYKLNNISIFIFYILFYFWDLMALIK